ncbi:MAG: hypothetical protein NWF05_02345 [Candidatus Bathyarchaeota archaeon]|nr:hypothetical protein [Candidatus Bathyarchaeota archaeon]
MEKIQTSAQILREISESQCCFTDNFRGFETVDAVRRLFGEKTAQVLKELKVEFTHDTIYMRVTDDGRLLINPDYFQTGNPTDIYLDIIHELVHVKQVFEGKSSNPKVSYVDRPLEIEAYGVTVNEAKSLNLSEERILDYLESELVKGADLRKLCTTLELNPNFSS